MAKDKIAKAFLAITKDKFTIDTIAEMIATKHLAEGDVVRLNGYYSAGDGAGHKRKIEATDDGSGVQLANGLWANIVHNGEVNVSWFGAKGDGVTDDTSSFQKACNFSKVFFDGTYTIKNLVLKNSLVGKDGRTSILKAISQLNDEDTFMRISQSLDLKNVSLITNFKDTNSIGLRILHDDGLTRIISTVKIDTVTIDGFKQSFVADKIYWLDMYDVRGFNFEQGIQINKKLKDYDPNFATDGYYSYFERVYFKGGSSSNLNSQVFYIRGFTDIVMQHCALEYCYKLGVFEAIANLTVISPYFEVATNGVDFINITGNTTIVGGYYNSIGKYIYNTKPIGGKLNITGGGGYGNSSNLVFLKKGSNFVKMDTFTFSGTEPMEWVGDSEGWENQNLIIDNIYYSTKTNPIQKFRYYGQGIDINPFGIDTNSGNSGVEFARGGVLGVTISEGVISGVRKSHIEFHENGTGLIMLGPTGRKFFVSVNESDSSLRVAELVGSVNEIKNSYLEVNKLNTPYHTAKMQQEGVYEDFIIYMDEKTEYDILQREAEAQRQLAFEQSGMENYEEWLAEQPMMLPVIEEPQPSEALLKFKEKYLG